MGGVLSGEVVVVHDKALIEEYRRAPLHEVIECRNDFLHLYAPGTRTINLFDFDSVFGMILGDTSAHFELFDSQFTGLVDVTEVFITMYLYSRGGSVSHQEWAEKLRAIFDLCNDSGSGSLSQGELTMVLAAGARGLCKLSGQRVPTTEELEAYSVAAFSQVVRLLEIVEDVSGDGVISVSELETWVLGQRELELYVAKFVGARSLAIAGAVFKLRLGALKRAAAHATEEISSVKQDDIRCVMERTKLRLKKKETKFPLSIARSVFATIFNYDSTDGANFSLSEEQFFERPDIDSMFQLLFSGYIETNAPMHPITLISASKPLIAFDVADENGDGNLASEDLKYLLWILNETARNFEPEPEYVCSVLRATDVHGRGKISRAEWVSHCLSEEKLHVDGSPARYCSLSNQLEELWYDVDSDENGLLSLEELEHMILCCLDYLADNPRIPESATAGVLTMVFTIAEDIMSAADADGNGSMDWLEFHAKIEYVSSKITELRLYVESVLKERGAAELGRRITKLLISSTPSN